MEYSIIASKSKAFAVRIIKLRKHLEKGQKEYTLSQQILNSGTSIGANIREALRGQSKADFKAKMCIALKEADETLYWLELLFETEYINREAFLSLQNDCEELIKILVSILKSKKKNL